jgi:hypothetical protein
MLDEAEGGDWISWRNSGVRRAIERIGERSEAGIPYLAPEIQLFYKADRPRPKDEEDFAAALPLLDPAQRQWLTDAITTAYGTRPWTPSLSPPLCAPTPLPQTVLPPTAPTASPTAT